MYQPAAFDKYFSSSLALLWFLPSLNYAIILCLFFITIVTLNILSAPVRKKLQNEKSRYTMDIFDFRLSHSFVKS